MRPRWVYNDGSAVDYVMALPQRPWDFESRGFGGSDVSAAGVPVAYEIRRDYLLHLTLRLWEAEWGSVERLVRHLQRGGSASFEPDSDEEDAHTVYGVSPAMGEAISPRTSELGGVLELDVTVRRTTSAIMSDEYYGVA